MAIRLLRSADSSFLLLMEISSVGRYANDHVGKFRFHEKQDPYTTSSSVIRFWNY